MNTQHEQLDMVLERLLAGESVEALSREFPAYAEELVAHARVMRDLSKAASMRPSEEGLRRALSSMRAYDARREMETPYMRVSAFFMTYRTALVLPVLVIVLAATGAVVLPLSRDPQGAPAGDGMMPTAAENGERSAFSAAGAPPQSDAGTAQSAPMMLKSAQTAPAGEPMPQDQGLASVFGSEMRNDTQDAMAAQSTAAEGANDSEDVATYDNAYDASDL